MKNNRNNRKLLQIRIRNTVRKFRLKPLIVYTLPNLSRQEIEHFQKQWNDEVCGLVNGSKIPIITGEFIVNQCKVTTSDSKLRHRSIQVTGKGNYTSLLKLLNRKK